MPRRKIVIEGMEDNFIEPSDEDMALAFSDDEDRIYEIEKRKTPPDWRQRLNADGSPLVSCIIKNKREIGAISPMYAYLEASPPIELKSLAVQWNVPYDRIVFWSREQNWKARREQYWEEEAKRVWEYGNVELAELRGQALKRATSNFRTMQEVVMEYANYGKKEKLVNGVPVEVGFEPKDLQNLTKAITDAHRGELAALGLNLIVQKDGEGAEDEQGRAPVQMVVFNMPATKEETERFIAIPRQALPESVFEADVVSETGETNE